MVADPAMLSKIIHWSIDIIIHKVVVLMCTIYMYICTCISHREKNNLLTENVGASSISNNRHLKSVSVTALSN